MSGLGVRGPKSSRLGQLSMQRAGVAFVKVSKTAQCTPEVLIPGALASQRNRSVPHGTQLLATCARGRMRTWDIMGYGRASEIRRCQLNTGRCTGGVCHIHLFVYVARSCIRGFRARLGRSRKPQGSFAARLLGFAAHWIQQICCQLARPHFSADGHVSDIMA